MALNTVSSDRLSTNVKTSNLGTELSKKVGQNKNLIINGAMQVSVRGTSGSTAGGYPSLDRFYTFSNGLDENPTMSQESLTSSDTPFSSGFRKYLRFQNGNQTSGAGSSDQTFFRQGIEAQNVAQSGWNYTSSSSFITLSFWIRASVAQTYYGFLKAPDGSNYLYPFSMALSANTWTKVTKSIPGNSNLAFDNDTGLGLEVGIYAYLGTSLTDNAVSLDAWAAYSSGTTRTPDHTTTWYTTNDSTIDMTGVQLEVGSVATDFEHRSFAVEKKLCERYFRKFTAFSGIAAASGVFQAPLQYDMRAIPSGSLSTGNTARITDSAFSDFEATSASITLYNNTATGVRIHVDGFSGLSTQKPMTWLPSGTNQSDVHLAAEL